ncbi:hypothetical protein N7481_009279 [Penicillium waksmanii]|uniref:uncharacterized protein n=1 Tax=Penicillium waksmanii TaxID=69791 RepID=UPI002547C61C|nr:uncharacterized protein N7481_009279 [Penicillium waksmanii]KAJ5975572.1 hypothetical protein N7481_009279 [Penicillium waksmanii]
MTIPTISLSERDDFDELEVEDDACAVDVFVADNVGDVEREDEVIEVGVGIDDIEAEAEAASLFVKIWMLW